MFIPKTAGCLFTLLTDFCSWSQFPSNDYRVDDFT